MLLTQFQPLARRTLGSLPKTSIIRPTSTIYKQTANMSSKPGEEFEVRQTSTSEDYTPDPSKSIKLSPQRQALIDDIIALYSCEPTVRRVERYTPDCVYDDQFVYANDRYKMAGQWFALPKLFKASKNERYEIIKNDRDLIQFKNEQVSQRSYHTVEWTSANGHSHGPSRLFPRPPPSTHSSHCLSTPTLWTRTSFKSSTTRTRQTTRTTRTKA